MTTKTILLTGGAGFIGSNYAHLIIKDPEVRLVILDKLTYAGDLRNLQSLEGHPRLEFVEGDICDEALMAKLFDQHRFDQVIHFAAESHVDNSISGPAEFIRTNIVGTFTLVHQAYLCWMEGPFKMKDSFKDARFLHVSTDEVYGSLGETGLFTEQTAYAPNSPYSASKASSDFVVRSYFHTYGLPVVTTNCSNNYGPHQHKEKLIPTIIRSAINGKSIPIYGDGKNIRDWLYVEDHCEGIRLAVEKGRCGETYNIGGHNERENIYIAQTICDLLDELRPAENSYRDQITYVKDRPGHDFRYAIDPEKIVSELDWQAKENFESGIRKTVQWYLDNTDRL